MSPLFMDFDGTLVNSQGRLYRLFRKMCPECEMSYEEYWAIKRERVSQAEILKRYYGYDAAAIRRFHETWLQRVEDEDMLKYDFPVDGISERLVEFAQRHSLYLLTARQKPELVERQVDGFGWGSLFTDLIVTRQSCDKCEAVVRRVGRPSSGAFIGDTGEDINMAKKLGLRSVAAGWGILSPGVLREYSPDYLAERIEDLDNCPFI